LNQSVHVFGQPDRRVRVLKEYNVSSDVLEQYYYYGDIHKNKNNRWRD